MSEEVTKQRRAVITIALQDVSDETALAIKSLVENEVANIDTATVELRMATVPNNPRTPFPGA
jgi:hypothetical protein